MPIDLDCSIPRRRPHILLGFNDAANICFDMSFSKLGNSKDVLSSQF